MSTSIIEQYKSKVIDILKMTYNNQISDRVIEEYVEKIVAPKRNIKLVANIRNLYKYIYADTREPNDIYDDIYRDELNILSNGLFTENWNPISYYVITDWMDSRQVYKDKMKEAKAAGDLDDYYEYNNKQNKVKANTNSIYGASTMEFSYVSNIDMGGAITAQARNFISEQVWTIERYLAGNFTFENINEIMCWLDQLFKLKADISEEYMKYIDFVPTADDCLHKFVMITRDVIGIRRDIANMDKSIFIMFDGMSAWKRVLFYYANNPIEFIRRNKYVYNVVKDIVFSDVEFINPYDIPDGLKTPLEELTFLMKIFCFATIINGNRVTKYQTRRRKVCVVGDTDSTMPTIWQPVVDTFAIYNRPDLIKDDKAQIRMTMIYVSLVTELLGECCLNFVKCCNSYHEKERFFMYMKNEFFFPVLLLFNVKKHYIGIQTIQEGKMIPRELQLAITGRALGSSGLNAYVSGEINDLLENGVLRAETYDPTTILKGVNKIQNHIIESIDAGDKTFGIYARFNGINNIKDPERTATARASCIWNEIYPDDYIVPGDAVYLFDTSLRTEQDLDQIEDEEIRERIRKAAFRPNKNNMDFSRFGLKTFAIPANGDHTKLPDWVIPFISKKSLCEKHLQPITTLYSSLLLSPCKYASEGSSVKKMGISTLVRF